ncbi:hypothetical protein ACLOJK_010879 [Asimina triloba]
MEACKEAERVQQCKRRKMEACREEEEDHISLLPDHILCSILSRLPISHAAQTSVLSKRWAHVWKSAPSIAFRRDLESYSSALTHRSKLQRLARDVARHARCVFAAHTGPVSACELVHSQFNPMSDIERWIQQLSRRRIQHLALICRREAFDRYSAWPFEHEEEQRGGEQGVLENARPFAGCVDLTTLRLDSVHLSDQVLADIIRCCVALEQLVLCDCLGLSEITIRSATLKGLELKKLAGLTGSVDVKATSLYTFSVCDLSSAVVNCNLISDILGNSPHLERMSLQNCDLGSLRIRASNLKFLDLRMLRIEGDVDIDAPRLASLRMSDVHCTGLFDIATPNLQSLSSRYGAGADQGLQLKDYAYQSNADLYARIAHLFGKSPPEAAERIVSTPFYSLNKLSINLDLNNQRAAIVLAYLLKSCPHLQELMVLIENGTEGQSNEIFASHNFYSDKRHNESPYWEGQDVYSYITHQLKTVELRGFTGRLLELDFARFVIRRAVALQTMTVECVKGLSKEGEQATRLLKSLPRASLTAYIIIKPRF